MSSGHGPYSRQRRIPGLILQDSRAQSSHQQKRQSQRENVEEQNTTGGVGGQSEQGTALSLEGANILQQKYDQVAQMFSPNAGWQKNSQIVSPVKNVELNVMRIASDCETQVYQSLQLNSAIPKLSLNMNEDLEVIYPPAEELMIK